MLTKGETILPDTPNRVAIKWSDIVAEEKKMQIQFSAADSLSKDPSIKLQQLQQLAQVGVIPRERIAQFMELPDLEGGYSLSNNAINAVLSVIRDCIENDNMEIPDYIPIPMLKNEIINTQLSLRAANYEKNKDDIDKLTELYKTAMKLELQVQYQQQADMMQQQAQQAGQTVQQETEAQMNGLDQVNNQLNDMQTGQGGLTGWDQQPYNSEQGSTNPAPQGGIGA